MWTPLKITRQILNNTTLKTKVYFNETCFVVFEDVHHSTAKSVERTDHPNQSGVHIFVGQFWIWRWVGQMRQIPEGDDLPSVDCSCKLQKTEDETMFLHPVHILWRLLTKRKRSFWSGFGSRAKILQRKKLILQHAMRVHSFTDTHTKCFWTSSYKCII